MEVLKLLETYVFGHLRGLKILSEASTIVYDEFLIEHLNRKTAQLVVLCLKFFGLEYSKLKGKESTVLPGWIAARLQVKIARSSTGSFNHISLSTG